MPLFAPRPFQRAYSPVERPTLWMRFVLFFESLVKRLLFGCRMCGNCILQETAFICPMACPKGLRNGPCGGSTSECCYVDRTRPCVWYRINERAERWGLTDRLDEVQAPLDWSRVGRSTWLDVWHRFVELGGNVTTFLTRRKDAIELTERAFEEIRIPEWWRFEESSFRREEREPVSGLEDALRRGEMVVTAECTPPASSSTKLIEKRLSSWRGLVDAVNFTANPAATARMNSLSCSVVALELGIEPVLQVAARDLGRNSLQSEILGAAALGVRNVLSITGDHSRLGPRPMGRLEPLDLDSLQQLYVMRKMRDEGRFLDGREIRTPPQLFLGAAASPFSSEIAFQVRREAKKVQAGAQFLQTQCVFDIERFERWIDELGRTGVLEDVRVLVGITPLKSYRAANFMNERVPGITIPDEVIQRIRGAENTKEEGLRIALETMDRLRCHPGVSGFHIMAVGWEKIVPRLIEESGLIARRSSSKAGDCDYLDTMVLAS